MHKEWRDKSISEKLEWYTGEIDKLIEYIAGKGTEQLHDEDISKVILEKIKDRMKIDRDSMLDKSGTGGEELEHHLEFYEAVEKASRELPEYNTDRKKWFEKLERAKKILVEGI